jgi:hypothetical protein
VQQQKPRDDRNGSNVLPVVSSHIDKQSRLSQAVFVCTACRYRANADHHAAKNTLGAGYAVLACREKALAFSLKQEPLGMGNLVPA